MAIDRYRVAGIQLTKRMLVCELRYVALRQRAIVKKNRAMNAFLGACISFVGVGAGIQTSQAAVLFDISGGGGLPLFVYGTATADNNVVNVPGQPAANNTGSTIVDASNTANWIGSIGGGSQLIPCLSFTGLIGTVSPVDIRRLYSPVTV